MTDLAATYKIKNLTVRYLIALSLVAFLSISAYLLIRVAIYKQASDSPVINYSGRQRMLSQKLSKETLLLTFNPSLKIKEHYRQELARTVADWLRVHNGLQFGDKELDLPGNNSEEVKDLFAKMEPYHQKMKIAVKRILTLKSNDLAQLSLDSHLIQDVVKASPLYLKWMDRTVFQYDHEAQVRVDLLKQYETYIIAAVLTLLVVEALLIFRPMVRTVGRTYGNLQQTNEQLKQEIVERKQAETALQKAHNELDMRVKERTKELQDSLAKVKLLGGLLPICINCKDIMDDKGNWEQIERYIANHSEAQFSHGICLKCAKKLYPKYC